MTLFRSSIAELREGEERGKKKQQNQNKKENKVDFAADAAVGEKHIGMTKYGSEPTPFPRAGSVTGGAWLIGLLVPYY